MQSTLRTRLTSTRSRLARTLSSLASSTYPGLYLHPVPSSSSTATSYSLSFLPTPPPSLSFSPTTIGTLDSPRSNQGRQEPEIVPRYFHENKDFLQLVHEVLKQEVGKDLWLNSVAKAVAVDGNDTY
ncbi:hypothetical protein JCM10212_005650, partial [Sporobolomyces blumeae]